MNTKAQKADNISDTAKTTWSNKIHSTSITLVGVSSDPALSAKAQITADFIYYSRLPAISCLLLTL